MSDNYTDIIRLTHEPSNTAPATLIPTTTTRLTVPTERIALDTTVGESAVEPSQFTGADADENEVLSDRLKQIQELFPSQPNLTVTFFESDENEFDGVYLTISNRIERLTPLTT